MTVKTARFSNLVAKYGKPELHLPLIDPSKDKFLQAAAKAHKVMTLIQENVGAKADHGLVGFEAGKRRQYLLFPKSLRSLDGSSVVGIKYDLLNERQSESVKALRPGKRATAEKSLKPKQTKPAKKRPAPPPPSKVIRFKPEPPEETESDEVVALKSEVRKAMQLLEKGREVAAFNTLKKILET